MTYSRSSVQPVDADWGVITGPQLQIPLHEQITLIYNMRYIKAMDHHAENGRSNDRKWSSISSVTEIYHSVNHWCWKSQQHQVPILGNTPRQIKHRIKPSQQKEGSTKRRHRSLDTFKHSPHTITKNKVGERSCSPAPITIRRKEENKEKGKTTNYIPLIFNIFIHF